MSIAADTRKKDERSACATPVEHLHFYILLYCDELNLVRRYVWTGTLGVKRNKKDMRR